MASAQFAAQSLSSLSGETESGINRIVLHRGSALPASTCQDRAGSRAPITGVGRGLSRDLHASSESSPSSPRQAPGKRDYKNVELT
jgi:hypothetical protein